MTVHAGYDAIGDKCLGKAQPGTKALEGAALIYWNTTSDGIYNCRNIRGGSTKSAHAEGRAVDIHWTDEATGRVMADFLVAHNAELGIQCVIWWDRIWSFQVGHWHDYHGQDPHHGHLHVEQNWSGARELTGDAASRVFSHHQQEADMPLNEDDKKLIQTIVYDIVTERLEDFAKNHPQATGNSAGPVSGTFKVTGELTVEDK